MGSSRARIVAYTLLGVTALCGARIQLRADDGVGRYLDVDFPRDSPVLMVSFDLGPTTTRVRNMSIQLDLHAALLLRNTGTKPLSGLTLRVEAQDLTPSGKGSVTVPSLDVDPGEVFPVRIDMELMRPFSAPKGNGAMVQVSLDCALFNDLTAYGPDRLGSRRALMVYELEARRERQYFAKLLETNRLADIREELNFGLPDLGPESLGVEMLRQPSIRGTGEQALAVRTVSFPSSPVQALGGAARVSGSEVRGPQIDIRNSSRKTVRGIDMGWIVRDERGKDFIAGSTPSAVELPPVQTQRVTQTGALKFSHARGQPMLIEALLAFVNDVEFSDGSLWIPSRRDIEAASPDPVLRRALAASPEQQHLADVFRRKGIAGIADELRKSQSAP
jgi:hypothetical protein